MVRMILQSVGMVGGILAILAVSIAFFATTEEEVVYVEYERPVLPTTDQNTVETQREAPEVATTQIPERSETQVAAASESTREKSGTEVHRVKNPYATPALSDAALYTKARAAIVNLYCQSRGPLGSISGSGVIIDPKGVILTNAHVAQYLLLSTDPSMKVECFVRTGSPSQNRYTAEIIYLPAPWIAEHARDIAEKRPTGTGEFDYALLRITKTIDGSPLPAAFSHLPVDTRENVAFTGDRVLLAGYPAEFAIKTATGASLLYPTSVFTKIGDLLTFKTQSVDLLALGGAVIAQSGSSGGAVVNAWGYLVGIISTTSEGASTQERELRAVTLSYINRDVSRYLGLTLPSLLASDLNERASTFMSTEAPALTALLVSNIQ